MFQTKMFGRASIRAFLSSESKIRRTTKEILETESCVIKSQIQWCVQIFNKIFGVGVIYKTITFIYFLLALSKILQNNDGFSILTFHGIQYDTFHFVSLCDYQLNVVIKDPIL